MRGFYRFWLVKCIICEELIILENRFVLYNSYGVLQGPRNKNHLKNIFSITLFKWLFLDGIKIISDFINRYHCRQFTISQIHILIPKSRGTPFFYEDFTMIIQISCQFPTLQNYRFKKTLFIVTDFSWKWIIENGLQFFLREENFVENWPNSLPLIPIFYMNTCFKENWNVFDSMVTVLTEE